MIVKRCETGDLAEIYNIEKLSFTDPLKEETLKKGLSSANAYYYALFDSAMAAFMSYEKVLDEGQIISVAVHPDKRRKGYGRALLNEVIKKAKDDGINFFTLEVRCDNKAAIMLYESVGFKKTGVRRGYYQNPVCDAVLMDLEIGKD